MPVETPSNISELNRAYPLALDPTGQGAAHIRALKGAIIDTFPDVTGPVEGTHGALTAAAALQPSGPGELQVPALDTVGSRVKWIGLSGALSFIGRALANKWTLRKLDGATETQVMEVDGTGNIIASGSLIATAQVFSGTTNVMPIGAIILWHGAIADIPLGWALCDGTGGTPDLRSRMVIGAGGFYAPGSTGGASSVTLAAGNLPSHKHAIVDVAHGHTVTDSGHSHGITDPGHTHPNSTDTPTLTPGVGIAGLGTGYTFDAGDSATTGVSVNSATTGVTVQNAFTGIQETANTGSGEAFSIWNPFHALAFIKRVA